jgi:hypothetical protein
VKRANRAVGAREVGDVCGNGRVVERESNENEGEADDMVEGYEGEDGDPGEEECGYMMVPASANGMRSEA